MITCRLVITKWILVSAALAFSTAASAQYDAAKLRQVAGGYLAAVHLAAELQQSRCGDAFTKETDSFAQVTGELAGYLNPNDVNELHTFLASDGLREAQASTREFIEGWIETLARSGRDERASCDVAAASVAKVYESAKQSWEQAKADYGR
jgi:hypothetical protein